MTTVDSWDLLTEKDDLAVSELRQAPGGALAAGEVRLAVEKFALTMNNVTYARLGDAELPFWSAFPAPEGYGRVPVWAFVRVVESRHPGIAEGARFFGFVPMATHHVVPVAPTARGFLDTEPRRQFLPTWYRTFQRVGEPDALDDLRAVFRPVFPASFNLADFVAGHVGRGAKSLLVTGASAKTAIGLAHLARNTGLPAVGLTSPGNAGFARELGCYDAVAGYDELESAAVLAPAVCVDFTGDNRLIGAVHARFAAELGPFALVGYTHTDVVPELPDLADPQPEFFFTPAVEAQAVAAEGEKRFYDRYHTEEDRFLAGTAAWLTVRPARGPEAIAAGFRALLDGSRSPAVAEVFSPQ